MRRESQRAELLGQERQLERHTARVVRPQVGLVDAHVGDVTTSHDRRTSRRTCWLHEVAPESHASRGQLVQVWSRHLRHGGNEQQRRRQRWKAYSKWTQSAARRQPARRRARAHHGQMRQRAHLRAPACASMETNIVPTEIIRDDEDYVLRLCWRGGVGDRGGSCRGGGGSKCQCGNCCARVHLFALVRTHSVRCLAASRHCGIPACSARGGPRRASACALRRAAHAALSVCWRRNSTCGLRSFERRC